ncbi:hypothetical protein BS78_02G071000 [Paspalum vaginatum]|nr:hypothetical protein BS78_02G071000 [Paspalum vaginatum]
MVAKAKASSWPCLSFLKDALLLPTRNVKLFIPVLLLTAVTTLLIEIHDAPTNEVNNTKAAAPSIDYVKLRQVLRAERGFIKITISAVITICFLIFMFIMIVAIVYATFIQILPLFAASTTYSGDRYSLPGLFSKVILKGRHLRGPLITVVMVSVLDLVCKAPLGALSLPGHLGELYVMALSALPFLVFLYFDVVLLVAIAVSVADTKRRGASALRQAWRLMTQVWWKEGLVLVVVHFLVQVPSLSPLHRVALGYWKKSTPMGLALLAVYALLSGLMEIFYLTAAMVYYHQAMKSMKNTEVMAA